MNFLQNYINSSQPSTKPSSAKSNPKNPKNPYNGKDKENINFLNFSKIAINSTSKNQDKRCNTIDFIPNSFNISKFTTENTGPYKYQTETNAPSHIISSKNYSNGSHFRYKSIANMPYKMPVHEPNFKRISQKIDRTSGIGDSQIILQKNKNPANFQKSFQPQNYSISLQKKAGDLVEIPEISTPEKEKEDKIAEKDENFRIFSLMKSFKHVEIVSKQQFNKKESFLSSFSNNDKSILSFPDEITVSAQKNLLFFKKFQATPKLLTNLLKKHKNIINNNNNSLFPVKISETKADKILKCREKFEEIESFTNNFFSKEQKPSKKMNAIEQEDQENSNVNNSIYKFLLQSEASYQLNPHFLKSSTEINGTMRAVLIDWMSEVSTEFSLKRQTFLQAIYYLDKYLEKNKSLKKKTLQLVGVSSLLISSKLEVIFH